MHQHLVLAANLLATTANNTKHFHIGPWIIVPVLIVAAIIAVPLYIMRVRGKRRELESEWEHSMAGDSTSSHETPRRQPGS
jgi:hypothetical protein